MLIYLDISFVLLHLHCCLFSLHIYFISAPDMHNISISPLLFFHSPTFCIFLIFFYSLPFYIFLTIFNSLQFCCTLSLSLSLSLFVFVTFCTWILPVLYKVTSWLFAFYRNSKWIAMNLCFMPSHFFYQLIQKKYNNIYNHYSIKFDFLFSYRDWPLHHKKDKIK